MVDNWNNRIFLDIHTHVLYGVDDGPKTIEESMEIIRAAYKSGVRLMMATPHYGMWGIKFNKERADRHFKLLKEEIRKEFDNFLLGMGNELYYSRSVVEDLQSGKARPLAGTDYVLVEFSPGNTFKEIQEGLHNLIQIGYRPILAHVERYKELQKDLDAVEELIDMGVYIQINANSILGGKFDKVTRMCKKLLQNDMVHFMASDCHNNTTRKPNVGDAIDTLIEITDVEQAKRILVKNPITMLKNEFL